MCKYDSRKWIEWLNRHHIIIIYVLFISVILRILHISADTPLHQLFSEEGWKCFDARNYYLFGNWEVAPHPACYLHLHPVFTLIQYLTYSIFGMGYIQARLVSVVFSLGSVAMIIALIKKYYGSYWSTIAGIFAGLNFYFLMLNRTAVIETPAIFFMTLTVYLYCIGNNKNIFSFFSGVSFFIAIITKLYAIFLIVVMIYFFLFFRLHRNLFYFVIGFFSALSAYCLLWLTIYDMTTLSEVIQLNFGICSYEIERNLTLVPDNINIMLHVLFKLVHSITKRFIYLNHLFNMAPVCFILSFGFLSWFIQNIHAKKLNEIEFIAISWLLGGIGLLFIAKYSSIHHLLIVFPPLVFLSISFLKNVVDDKEPFNIRDKKNKYEKTFNCASKLVVLAVVQQIVYSSVMFLFVYFIRRTPIVTPIIDFNPYSYLWEMTIDNAYINLSNLPRVNAYEFWRSMGFLVSLSISIPLTFVLTFRQLVIRNYKNMLYPIIGIFLVINMGKYIEWLARYEGSVKRCSIQLGSLVDNSDLIIGGEFLGLENNIHFAHYHEPHESYLNQATHLFKMAYHPLTGFQTDDIILKDTLTSQFVKSFYICGHIYHLYKMK